MSKRYFQIGLLSVLMTVLSGVQIVQAGSQEGADQAPATEAMEESKTMMKGAEEAADQAPATEAMEESKTMMKGAEEAATEEATTKSKDEATEESEGFVDKVKSIFKSDKEE